MRKIIHAVNHEKKIIWIKGKTHLIPYQLSNKMSKIYLPIISPGLLIDFEPQPMKIKKRRQKIATIAQLVMLKPYRVLYDIDALRKDMVKVIQKVKYFAYIDFEMSMPPYSHRGPFQTEIIQYGVVVKNQHQEMIETASGYVFKKRHGMLSDRALKFLKIDQEQYLENAIGYHQLYEILQNIQNTYHPKWIVWGKNDIQVLNDSFKLHDKTPFVFAHDFMDLLKLHKDYYHLKDDLGLVRAYEMYYQEEVHQAHDALDDAKLTAAIMHGFIQTMLTHKKNRR